MRIILVAVLFASFVASQRYFQERFPLQSQQVEDPTCENQGVTCNSWSNLNSVLTNNSQGTTNNGVDTNEYTYNLRVFRFNFTIPSDNYIWGVRVNISRYTNGGTAYDNFAVLMTTGTENMASNRCNNQYCTDAWRNGNDFNAPPYVFGGPNFLWQISLTPTIVNNETFGYSFRGYSQSNNVDFRVDYISMAVYYDTDAPTVPAPVDLVVVSSSTSSNGGVIAVIIIVVILVIACVVVGGFLYIRRRKNGGSSFASAYMDKNGPIKPAEPSAVVVQSNNNANPTESTTPTGTPPNEKVEPKGWAASYETQGNNNENNVALTQSDDQQYNSVENPDAVRIVASSNQMDTVAMLQQSYAKPPPKPASNKAPVNESQKPKKPQPTGWAASNPPKEPTPKQEHTEDSGSSLNESVNSELKQLNYPSAKSLPVVANYANTGAGAFGKNVVFGVPLALSRTENDLPIVVAQTINHLQAYLNEEGILRLAGAAQDIKKLRTAYNAGENPDLTQYDCHAVGGALKNYLRELPIPLIILTQGLKDAIENNDIALLCTELQAIPKVHQLTIKALFEFLNQISNNSAVNKMPSANLAIVFRPTLKLSDNLLVLLTDYYPEIAQQMGW